MWKPSVNEVYLELLLKAEKKKTLQLSTSSALKLKITTIENREHLLL